ncbi:hypothetical protein T31B1_14564 [Salinisphaera sp. T31B1]
MVRDAIGSTEAFEIWRRNSLSRYRWKMFRQHLRAAICERVGTRDQKWHSTLRFMTPADVIEADRRTREERTCEK